MYAKVWSGCLHGVDGQLIQVEVDLSRGLPQTTIVGLPDSAIRESIDRVRAAIRNCGFEFPLKRITINLAPVDVRKEGASFDLAVAIAILLASKQITISNIEKTIILGELALDGTVRPVLGTLSIAEIAQLHSFTQMILPKENSTEMIHQSEIKTMSIQHLHFLKENKLTSLMFNTLNEQDKRLSEPQLFDIDYSDVNDHIQAKRALIIAAAGNHNILMIGPPGSGKTMLMRRLPTILPDLTKQEQFEIKKIHHAVWHDTLNMPQVMRPFRNPHHTITSAGLVGGGSIPRPGEITLAHHGVLYLDELPEFSKNVLEALRQPIEDRKITIHRSKAIYTFPAHFLLAASMNPCPCGMLGSQQARHECKCSPTQIMRYRSRISLPLLDRIDLHMEVPNYPLQFNSKNNHSLSSAEMRLLIANAQEMQYKRYEASNISWNSELTVPLMRKYCYLRPDAKKLLMHAYHSLNLSTRGHERLIRISRTIADLERSTEITIEHVSEAIQYRQLDLFSL